jgi:hypothetical protein
MQSALLGVLRGPEMGFGNASIYTQLVNIRRGQGAGPGARGRPTSAKKPFSEDHRSGHTSYI